MCIEWIIKLVILCQAAISCKSESNRNRGHVFNLTVRSDNEEEPYRDGGIVWFFGASVSHGKFSIAYQGRRHARSRRAADAPSRPRQSWKPYRSPHTRAHYHVSLVRISSFWITLYSRFSSSTLDRRNIFRTRRITRDQPVRKSPDK